MRANGLRLAELRTGPEQQGKSPFPSWPARALGGLSAALGTVAGITPHVLHHIGPIAGAAILTGTEGSVLFGVFGLALTLPLLVRLKRRFTSWAAPGMALILFAIMFTISTLWIGPAISRDGGADQVDPHHVSTSSLMYLQTSGN